MKQKILKFLERIKPKEIQTTMMLTFSVISISMLLLLSIVMYNRFFNSSLQETVTGTTKLLGQSSENMEDYLVSMRRISDSLYYNVIKENDFSSQEKEIHKGMNLLYEANRDNLRSIAIYNDFGSLLAAEPVAAQKEDPNITRQDWYMQAMQEVENLHFSVPHIQNLFDDSTHQYYWVLSLSRVVDLTDRGTSKTGVLLVDMDFSSISRMMKQMNRVTNGEYYYLCDSSGEIIYHPRQQQISDGLASENQRAIKEYVEGVYDETFQGEHRKVVVNTISYTGWKLVGVIPYETFTHGMGSIRYFIILSMLLIAMMLMAINRVVSVRISRPIMRLNTSVLAYEAGDQPKIYIGGPSEIRHLGYSIQDSYEQIDLLMRKIVLEQNERRKSELEVLQSQINPHFLYNTLESITWMIEGDRKDDAVFMISELATLFRISLSSGRTIIRIRDEIQHARSYMNMQRIRFKDSFAIEFRIDPVLEEYCTVKLILQPILENAINYGVRGMEDCGEILVTGRLEEGDIVLGVADNGLGMTEETADLLLTDNSRVHKHGSGVGLININNRIQILFGKEYGLQVESEPDEGTTVSIRFPAIAYTEENRKSLEKGRLPESAQSEGGNT